MTLVKEAHPWDEYFMQTEQCMQLALHCKSPELVPKVLEKINKLLITTKLRFEDHKFLLNEKEMPVFRLPDNFASLKDALEYMDMHHNPKYDVALAKVAANKDTIVINSSHSCTDGVYMLNLFNALRDDIDLQPTTTVSNSFDNFLDKIMEGDAHPDNDFTNPNLTRFTPKDRDFTSLYEYAMRRGTKSRAEDLKCYDPVLKRPTKLTDALYTQFVLSAAAYEGKFDKFGINTIMNLRPYLNTKDGFDKGCLFAIFDITAKNITMDTTIREIMAKTRQSYEEQLKRGVMWGWFQHLADEPDMTKAIPGVRLLLTNIGQFRLGGPFDDVFVDCTSRPQLGAPRLDLIHFGVIGENRNDCISMFDFEYNTVSPREVDMFAKSIHFGLENIELDETCGKALERITEFQQKFIKEEFPKYEYHYKA